MKVQIDVDMVRLETNHAGATYQFDAELTSQDPVEISFLEAHMDGERVSLPATPSALRSLIRNEWMPEVVADAT